MKNIAEVKNSKIDELNDSIVKSETATVNRDEDEKILKIVRFNSPKRFLYESKTLDNKRVPKS